MAFRLKFLKVKAVKAETGYGKEEIKAIYKAINNVSKRVNDVSQKLDDVMQKLNADTNEKITVNSGGIDGLADMVSTHDGAIEELATMVAELEVK